jgi:hypothetical protein
MMLMQAGQTATGGKKESVVLSVEQIVSALVKKLVKYEEKMKSLNLDNPPEDLSGKKERKNFVMPCCRTELTLILAARQEQSRIADNVLQKYTDLTDELFLVLKEAQKGIPKMEKLAAKAQSNLKSKKQLEEEAAIAKLRTKLPSFDPFSSSFSFSFFYS